jgi:8-oxo-dGTP diphosphatase
MKRISSVFLTVDIVVLSEVENKILILLIQRKNEPFKGNWALPGGFVDPNEDLIVAAERELREETGLTDVALHQLQTFGRPGRDPRGHMVTVVFYGFINNIEQVSAGDDAAAAEWFDISELPDLAFDHLEIIELAKTKL